MQVLGDLVRALAGACILPSGSSASRSMSDRGASSRRPYPPVATRARGTGPVPGNSFRDRGEQLGDHLVAERGDGAHHLLPAGPCPVPREDLLASRFSRSLAARTASRSPTWVCRITSCEPDPDSRQFCRRRRPSGRRIPLRRLFRRRVLPRRLARSADLLAPGLSRGSGSFAGRRLPQPAGRIAAPAVRAPGRGGGGTRRSPSPRGRWPRPRRPGTGRS